MMGKLILVLVLTLLIPSHPQADPAASGNPGSDEVEVSYPQKVPALYHSRKSREALELAGKWVDAEPDNPRAHFWLAKGFQRAGSLEIALREAKRAGELGYSNTLEVVLLKTQLLRDLKRYPESLELAREACRSNPTFWAGWQETGQTLKRMKRWEDAAPCYEKAMSLAPDEFWPVHLLGIARLLDGRATESVELLQRSLKISPNHPDSRLGLGFAWLIRGERAKAKLQYRLLKGKDILRAVVLLQALENYDRMGSQEVRTLAIETMCGE